MRSLAASALLALLCSACLKPATCEELLSCPIDDEDAGETSIDDGGVSSSSTTTLPDEDSTDATSSYAESNSIPDANITLSSLPTESEADGSVSIDGDAGTCGDGAFNEGEVCDDGNKVDEEECPYGQATCTTCNTTCSDVLELTGPICGDGEVNGSEACDEEANWCNACEATPMIAAGGQHTCTLLRNGGAQCWGQGVAGQLGNGLGDDQKIPVAVSGLGSGVQAIVTGSLHSCALLMNGGVKCWGDGTYGQVGDGETTTRRSPVNVVGLESGVVAIAAGNLHTCAVLATGNVKCWGHGASGALGNGKTEVESTPVDVMDLSGVVAITAGGGGSHTCALLTTGATKCWGAGTAGQLGDGDSASKSTAVEVAGLDSDNVTSVAAGGQHSCARLETTKAKCWGRGASGQLGNNSPDDVGEPVEVSEMEAVLSLAAGGSHTCAVVGPDRHVACWGEGEEGQLGLGDTDDEPAPAHLELDDVRMLAAGAQHTCALLIDNSVQCWGRGDNGQLGNGTQGNQVTPVAVLGLP